MIQEQLRPFGVVALKANEEARILNLAGMFEVGGTVNFIEWQDPQYEDHQYVYPAFTMNNGDVRTQAFKEIYGGSRARQSVNSWGWRKVGPEAFKLAVATEPFAPSRSAVIAAIRACEQLQSFEEKRALHKSFEGRFMDLDLDKDKYTGLVELSAFVAGVCNARGALYLSEKWDTRGDYPYGIIHSKIDIASKNHALLEALQRKFGGSVILRWVKSQEVEFAGRLVKMRDDSSVLKLGSEATRQILTFIGTYSLIGEPDGFAVEKVAVG